MLTDYELSMFRQLLEPLGFVFEPSQYNEGHTIKHPQYPKWVLYEWECKYLKNPFEVIKHLVDWKAEEIKDKYS